jgi:CRP/FNR family transcriptional regulator, anaerobic regulatory protein
VENSLIYHLQTITSLSSIQKELITAAFHPLKVKEDACLFSGGAVCHHLYFITKGVLKFVSSDDQGKDAIHFFLPENHFCTILDSFLNQKVIDDRIQAACETEVLSVNFLALQKVYLHFPEFKSLLDDIFQRQLLEKVNLRNAYLNKDALSRYLLFIEKQPDIALRVKMQDVASYLGIAPQSLSRLRKQIS